MNYAQRVESLTKELSSGILLNDTTYDLVKEFVEVRQHGPLNIKGKEDAIYVYEVLDFWEQPRSQKEE